MTGVVNLNRARKTRARAEAAAQAARNRQIFGRSKADTIAAETVRAKAEALLDGHKREP